MQTGSLAVFALVAVLAIAGCTGVGGPGTPVPDTTSSPTPTASTTASPSPTPNTTPTLTPTATAGSCERPTPDPVPDLLLANRLDDSRSLSVTITPADRSSPIYEETLRLGPDEDADRYDVVPEPNRYRITASLPDNTSATRVMELEPGNRYGIVTVTVQKEGILVERLNVHPEPTPTPCSNPAQTPAEPTSTPADSTQGTEQPTPHPS